MAELTASDPPGISVLGTVTVNGSAVTGLLPRRLIAALALAAPHTLGSEALVDALWGDEPPTNVRSALQTLVSRTRAVAGSQTIELTASGYRLTAPSDIDAVRSARDDGLENALSLWRGEPGDDLGDAPVAEELRAAAHSLRQDLTRRRAAQLMHDRRWTEAVPLLTVLVDAAPLGEADAVLLMRALDGAGRRNDALATFARLRDALADTLGTDPGREAVDLNAALLRAEAVPRARIGVREPTTPLIGRHDDIATVESLLTRVRLVTLLGVGGLGKTSLAQEIARRSASPFVVVVELAGTTSSEDIMLTIATTLGIRTSVSRISDPRARIDLRTRVVKALTEAEALLVLDNCEHLVDAAAEIAADLIAAVPALRILATSRAPLAIIGEHVVPLPPLQASDAASPAVALFIERARAVRPQAALDLVTVARICERLDGLPLAIELAAARVRSMALDDIERRLRDRFALLSTVDRAAPERHRTLFAVIDWSWKLLESRQRTLLRRLSLFADGFTSDAARAVAGRDDEPIDDLDALVMQSLLTVHDDDGTVRFRMLETVREFTRDRLIESNEADSVESALLDWSRDFARAHERLVFGSTQLSAMHSVAAEQENLIAALRRAIERERLDVAVSIFGLLAMFWSMRGEHEEVLTFGPGVVALARRGRIPDAVVDIAAVGLLVAALTLSLDDTRIGLPALALVRRLRRVGRTSDPRVHALLDLTLAIASTWDADDLADLDDVIERVSQSSDPVAAAIGTMFGANVAENNGESEKAKNFARRTHRLAREFGDTWMAASSAATLAQLHSESGDASDAAKWSREARSGLRALGADADLVQIDSMLALALVQQGDDSLARELFSDDDDDDDASGEAAAISSAVRAEVALRDGRTDAALALYDEAIRRFRTPAELSSPWFLLISSARLSAGMQLDEASAQRDAVQRLRTRIIAVSRLRLVGTDQPVTGGAIIGPAVWALGVGDLRDVGLELLALSERMSGRQDFAPVARHSHFVEAARLCGASRVAAARSAAAELDAVERVRRVNELLSDRRWREA